MEWLFMAAFVLAAALPVWWGVQGLKQGHLLAKAAAGFTPRGDKVDFAGRGRVVVDRELRAPTLGPCLWYKEEELERRGSGKHKHWAVVSTREEWAAFKVTLLWGELRLSGHPTEIHGRRVEERPVEGSENWLGSATRRVREQVLPVSDLTVLGRLRRDGERWVLEKHPILGLLVSTDAPGPRAWKERMKGVFCLVVAGVILWVGLIVLGSFFNR